MNDKIMANIRIIPRLDIKGETLIKSVHLEGLRVIGEPSKYAVKYYLDGADELIYMDCVASLYGRNSLSQLIANTVKKVFVPITVGGGIRSVEDARAALISGADKVAINTAAVKDDGLITRLAEQFGSQSVVLSVEAKKTGADSWEVYTDNGRERTGLDVVDWVRTAVDRGAGEVLLTSIDREGTRKGFDMELTNKVSNAIHVPVIASGGLGVKQDFVDVVNNANADAVAIADALHYDRLKLRELRSYAIETGIPVRRVE